MENATYTPADLVHIFSSFGFELECLAKDGAREARRLERKYGYTAPHVAMPLDATRAEIDAALERRSEKLQKNKTRSDARFEARMLAIRNGAR